MLALASMVRWQGLFDLQLWVRLPAGGKKFIDRNGLDKGYICKLKSTIYRCA